MPRHLPSLDGLRALAVLLVLWCHVPMQVAGYPEWLKTARSLVGPGGLGVELFFALSGFLITRILLAERDRGMPVRWFLLRRLLRIFPIYYLLLAVIWWSRAAGEPTANIGWAVLYLGNFADVFAPSRGLNPLSHTWSLCVEEHFYLLWPFAVAFCTHRTSRRILLFVLIPVAVLGAVSVGLLCEQRTREVAIERLSPFRFLTLAAGALAAYAEPWLGAGKPSRTLLVGAAFTATGMILHPLLWFAYIPFFVLQVTWWPLELAPAFVRVHSALLCTGLLLCSLTARGVLASPHRALALAPLRAIGRISYGLYLYHLPIYQVVIYPEPTAWRTTLAIVATFAVATVSYWLIERPILRYAAKFRDRPARS